MSDLFDLSGKVAVVTGGSRGMGREMILAFAQHGADVVIASRKLDACEELAEEVRDTTGRQALPVACHVGYWDQCDALCDTVYDEFGRCDVLVNNAGLTFTYIAPHRYRRGYSEKFFELSDDVVQNVMDTNFVAADRMARLVTPHLIKQGGGRLVNVTTRIETMTKPGASPYGPSKAALENASEVWVKDLEDTGVTVNILNPGGAANTEGFEISEDRAIASEAVGGMVEPYKMVAPICWLVSDDAKNTTGMRYDASDWDESLPPEDEAIRVGRPLGLTLKPPE